MLELELGLLPTVPRCIMRETMTEIPIPSITTGGSGLGSYVLFLTVVGRKTSKPIHAVRNRGFCVPGVKTS